jgi:glyoxylase-like metal-dependent hydrolase (beta-lactamase superfamily II)
MIETIPAFVGDSINADHFVPLDDPRATEYARVHLEEVKGIIGDALKVLAYHGKDVAEEAEAFKNWLAEEVDKLT